MNDLLIDLLDRDDLSPRLYNLLQHIFERGIGEQHSEALVHMNCDWRVAVENTLEDVHVPYVHQTTFHQLGLQIENMERHGKDSMALYQITGERTLRGLRALKRYFDHVNPAAYFHIFLYPHTCISSVGGYTYSVQDYLPTEAGSTTLRTRLFPSLTRPGAPDLGFFFDAAAAFNLKVFHEDAAVCDGVPVTTGMLQPEEKRVAWFREALQA